MPEERDKILKFTQNYKSMESLFVSYADVESLFEKIKVCINCSTKFFTSKLNKQTVCCYSLFTHYSFDNN